MSWKYKQREDILKLCNGALSNWKHVVKLQKKRRTNDRQTSIGWILRKRHEVNADLSLPCQVQYIAIYYSHDLHFRPDQDIWTQVHIAQCQCLKELEGQIIHLYHLAFPDFPTSQMSIWWPAFCTVTVKTCAKGVVWHLSFHPPHGTNGNDEGWK